MDNPPSTTNSTRLKRRVLVSSGVAIAAAGCVGAVAAGAAGSEPLLLSSSYVRNEVPLVHTQTAARPVIFKQRPSVARPRLEQLAAALPTTSTTVAPAAIAALAAPAAVPAKVTAPPPTVAAPRPAPAPAPASAPTPTTAAPPPAPTPTTAAPARAGADPSDPATWDRLAQCESGGNWATNTGNGYYGGLQFSASTWRSVGGTGLPHQNSREVQIEMGQRLQARAGWGQWPSCSRKLGYR